MKQMLLIVGFLLIGGNTIANEYVPIANEKPVMIEVRYTEAGTIERTT